MKAAFVVKLAFKHSLRPDSARFLAVLPFLPPQALRWLGGHHIYRGEIYCDLASKTVVLDALRTVGIYNLVHVNASKSVGYILHSQAEKLSIQWT